MVDCRASSRTSSHSAERLNLCLSGKELRLLSSTFHLSLFPVTCAGFLFLRPGSYTDEKRRVTQTITCNPSGSD